MSEGGDAQARASSLSLLSVTCKQCCAKGAAVEPDQLARRLQRDSGLGATGSLVLYTNSGTELVSLSQVARSLCHLYSGIQGLEHDG